MKLSIIIAAYNVEKYIKKCVESCINQSCDTKLYEIIVVNDGSTDCTLDIMNEMQAEHSNLAIVNQDNMGLGASRNIGVRHSQGSYLWFIDGDDYIESNILENILKKIEHNRLDILALDYKLVDDAYKEIHKNNSFVLDEPIVNGSSFYKYNFEQSYTPIFIFKKILFTENNIYFRERINMQDSEILPKLLIHAKRVSFYDYACYYYVQHLNSFTNTNNGEKRYQYFKSIIEVKNSLQDFLYNLKNDNEMKIGLEKKIYSLNMIVFNHLVFFQYEREWLLKCIEQLNQNGLYPLSFKPKRKLVLIKYGMNNFPVFTKKIIDKYLKFKSKK